MVTRCRGEGWLNLALHGTRDAAKLWQEKVAKHFISFGFRQGRSNPFVYLHKKMGLRTLIRGDGYATVGRCLRQQLESAFEMKTVIAGHCFHEDVVQEENP